MNCIRMNYEFLNRNAGDYPIINKDITLATKKFKRNPERDLVSMFKDIFNWLKK